MYAKARVIAIYLPQYHPIPENDAVWGKGFTEWTNVVRAKPLFKGHYQPRIPRDLGFYDLRLPEVREAQADLARKAGIEGFMYWQYYFGNGKMLLEKPFEAVLKSGKPDFPFCLGWANHSWQTKTWKNSSSLREGKTMIQEQLYGGVSQYKEHFLYNLPAFKDKRYICVDGKPVFVIWNPKDHSDEIAKLIATWKALALENGLSGIHFVGKMSMGDSLDRLMKMGFDAVYQERIQQAMNNGEQYSFLWKLRSRLQRMFGLTIFLNKHDFAKCHSLLVDDSAKKTNVYPSFVAGYDRSPRAGSAAQLFYNFTPATWKKHVDNVLKYVSEKDDEHKIIFLKSWNEWGESNYMEPDLKYGTALLDEMRKALLPGENK